MFLSRARRVTKGEQRVALRTLLPVSLLILVGWILLWTLPPHEHDIYPPCPWFALTDSYCPGCGSLRGLSAVVNGDVLGLVRNNALAAVSSPFLLYAYLALALKGTFAYQLPRWTSSKWGAYIILAAVVAFGLVRNYVPALAPGALR